MDGSTVIDSNEFLIRSESALDVDEMVFTRNKKIEYLPANIAEKFANVYTILAANCSIKSVSKENFQGLQFLRRVVLENNQIERIDSDTFTDLEALSTIDLSM